jgi:hypothetical protein
MSALIAEAAAIIASARFDNVGDLLDAFHRGAATANLQEYFGCFHQEGRFLGTDASENWHVLEFYGFSKPYFERGTGWTYVPRPATRKTTFFPNEACPSFCVFDELLDSQDFHATTRGSGTCLYSEGRWLLAQYHLSFPLPNDLAKDVTRVIASFEAAVQHKEAEAAAAEAARELLAELDAQEGAPRKAPGGATQKKSGGKKKK